MDKDTVLFLIAIIGCGIGVSGFLVGMTARAKKDGELLAQLSFCVKGIDEIKGKVEVMSKDMSSIKTDTATQDRRIETLEREIRDFRKRVGEIV